MNNTVTFNNLTFKTLELANMARLPLFKNSQGELAHSKADGSDWTPADWLQAMVGELGEYAALRAQFEAHRLTFEEFSRLAAKELADAQIYFSILCKRALDKTQSDAVDHSQLFGIIISLLGEYANDRKKYVRGDIDKTELSKRVESKLSHAINYSRFLHSFIDIDVTRARVTHAHPTGVDIAQAVTEKFNEVSERVGCSVRIDEDGGSYTS